MGSAVVTDRAVLLHLLEAAENADYRFLVLDVRFDQGMHTDSDSALWAVMARCRDLPTARTQRVKMPPTARYCISPRFGLRSYTFHRLYTLAIPAGGGRVDAYDNVPQH